MRSLSRQEIQAFREDGVALVPAAVEPQWVQRLLQLVDQQMAQPSDWANDANPENKHDRLFTDRYLWQENATINAYIRESGVAALAGQAMGSSAVRFYFDHLLVKEPGTSAITPWHQDVPYWPFLGKQICSVWLALTAATVAGSAMEFVRGSHLDDTYYMPEVFGARDNHPSAWAQQGQGKPVPDIEANRGAYDIIGFDVEPGDAVVFSAWLLHGARGNASPDSRRAALSTRWLGDDASWHPHPGADPTVNADEVDLRPGEYPADDRVFPLLWQA
jgi:ectoine hydroxylase-related dioxygenase (phytanoyl-CoA dioxygenase family)